HLARDASQVADEVADANAESARGLGAMAKPVLEPLARLLALAARRLGVGLGLERRREPVELTRPGVGVADDAGLAAGFLPLGDRRAPATRRRCRRQQPEHGRARPALLRQREQIEEPAAE